MPNFRHAKKRYIYNTKFKSYNETPKGFKSKGLNSKEILFDSRAELIAYLALKKQESLGLIQSLRLQVPFPLLPKRIWLNNVTGKKDIIRDLTYIADFVFERNGVKVICDCKGWVLKKNKKTEKSKWTVFVDDIYKIKKKLVLSMYTPEYQFEEM